jgi:leucine-zipper-like transcriptional regulator 1
VTLQGTVLEAANDVWYSKDGSNWVQVLKNAPFSARSGQTSLVFNNQLWVMHGNDRSVWSSPDGVNWTEATAVGGAEPLQTAASVFNNRIWMIAGGTFPATATLTDVWYSGCGNN